MSYFRIESVTNAITINTNPNHAMLNAGIRAVINIPKPKPIKLCIIACGVKHSFIILAFIFYHLLLARLKK